MKPPVPAVVLHMNSVAVVTAVAPEPVLLPEYPKMVTGSVEFPPVQPSTRGEVRGTFAGRGVVRLSGVPKVSEALNLPTCCHPGQ